MINKNELSKWAMNLTTKGKTKNFTTNGRRKFFGKRFHNMTSKTQSTKNKLINSILSKCIKHALQKTSMKMKKDKTDRQEKISAKAYIKKNSYPEYIRKLKISKETKAQF